jgi:hypothetical protein
MREQRSSNPPSTPRRRKVNFNRVGGWCPKLRRYVGHLRNICPLRPRPCKTGMCEGPACTHWAGDAPRRGQGGGKER